MDLGKWLRDRKDQAVRQWQDSVVLDAVSSGTKADNDRRANQGTAETVRQRASQSYGNGFSGVMNRARDVVDADTPADWIKRQANSGLFETYQEQQNRLTNEAVNSQTDRTLPAQFGASGLREMGKFFLKAPGSIANMYGAVAQSENPIAEVAKGIIPGLGVYSDADKRMGHAASQDLQRQANDLNKQIDQKINQNDYIGERQGENKWAVGLGSVIGQLSAQISTGGAGLVNTGVQMASDEYNKAREAGRSNDQALGIGTLQGAASAASEKFGIDKFLPGNGVAGNSVIKVLKRFGTEGGQEAQQQFTQNLIANKTYDPNQSLKDGVFESAILGGFAGSAMSPIADLANIGTTPNTPTQLTPEVQNKRNNLANAYTTLVDQGRPDQAAYFAREIDQIDNPAPGTLRERIRSAKDMIMPKGEGGYIRIPGRDTELMVTHNLSAGNLAKAQELGGIPQASVGIVDPKRSVIDGFGDITLVGNEKLVDPKSQGTRTYASDVYSVRQPKGEIQAGNGTITKLRQHFKQANDKYGKSSYIGFDSADNLTESMANEPSVIAQFLEENGIKPDVNVDSTSNPRYAFSRQMRDANLEDKFQQYIEKTAKDAGGESKIFAGWTNSGSKRLLPETMDNILGTMRKERLRAGESFFGNSIGGIRGSVTPKFKSLEDIYKAKDRLTTNELMEATKETLDNKLYKFQGSLEKYVDPSTVDGNKYTEIDRQLSSIGDYLRGGSDRKWFNQKFPNAPASIIKQLDDFKKEIQNAPTEYFESVSDRAVKLNEFEKALIPESLPKAQREAIVAQLNAEGVQPRFYKEGQRQQALIKLMEEDNLARKTQAINKKQGGYAKNPFYRGDDVAGGLSKEQSEFINDYANMLEGMGAGNGVDITPDGRRISNNVRDASTAGKTMTKQDWFDKARKDIGSGKAGFGASDEYKKLTVAKPVQKQVTEKQNSVDPLESLKQEARKYKSAEEFVKAQGGRVNEYGSISMPDGSSYGASALYEQAYREAGLPLPNKELKAQQASRDLWQKELADFREKTKVTFPENIKGSQLDELKLQAKNYNNADEFIESYGTTVHRGTPNGEGLSESIDIDYGPGYYFTEGIDDAKAYGKTSEYKLKLDNPYTVKDRYAMNSLIDRYMDERDAGEHTAKSIKEYLQQKGHDGIIVEDGSMAGAGDTGRYIIAYDPSKIATKQQLTDLYNQATQSQPPKSPLTPNNQRTIDSYSTPKPVTEYKVGEKVSVATAQGGEVNGTITKTPDFSKDLRIKGNDFSVKLEDGTIRKTDGAGFGDVQSPLTVEKNIEVAKKQAQATEKLKQEKKITPKDDGYWTTPVKGQAKDPIPNVKDVNGVQVKEGDVIEVEGLLGGKARRTVQWQEPQIANATGELQAGQWLGNGPLDNGLPFKIVDGKKPTLQDALEGKSTKPFTPLSQPVDNLPAVVKQVTKKQTSEQKIAPPVVAPAVQKQTPAPRPIKTTKPKSPERLVVGGKSAEVSSDGRIANIDEFVKQQVAEQEAEPEKTGRISKLKRVWIDTLSPAEDNFRQAVKDGKLSQETLDDIIVKNGKSIRSGTAANINLVESGLVDLLHNKSKEDYDNLGQTLIAIHAKDLRANGIETGRDAALDEQIVAKYGEQFKADIEQFRDAANYVLDKSVASQLISKETADMLKKKYPNYVPMNRVMEELENTGSFNSSQIASIGKQTVVRKIKGSKRTVENPLESMISKVQDMTKQSLKNEAAIAWVDALKKTGDAKLIEGTVKPGESTISVIRNGNKEIYSVEPEMEAAAKGLTKEQMGTITNAARKVSRVFKTGTTGLNLPFIVTNLARDQQNALLNQSKGELETFKAIPTAIMETLGHGKLYQEAVRNGAISTSFDLTKPNLKLTAANIRKRGSSLGALSKIEDVIGRSEEYTRIQQYKATKEYWLEQGMSESQAQNKATIAAQQNSADFARAGDLGQILNAWLPYTNAGVQGTRSTLRAAKNNPVRYATKAGAMLVMPTIMTALWNTGDEERKKIYDDISENDKQASFIVITPWAKKNEEGKWEGIVKIPKPPGISALLYPVEKGVASMNGLDPVGFKDIVKGVLGFGSPLGDNLNAAVSTVTPQAIKPAVEATINRNLFTNRDIVPYWLKDKPANEQAYKGSSGTARMISSLTGVSPIKVEHMIRGYGGELGLQGLNAADNALNKAGLIPKEQIGGISIPAGFKKRFTEAYDKPGSTIQRGTGAGASATAAKNYEDAVAGIKSSYGGKYAELTEEEVKELGKTDADAKDYYKTLQAVKQSSKTPDELPTNLNPLATSIYEKEARLTTDGKDKWNKRPSANKEVNNTIKSWLPKGVDAPRITNETTKKWADYEKKKADGTLGKLEEESAKRTILRSAYNSVLTEDEKDLYTLSKDKLLDAYDRGVINDQNIDKALKVERQLFDAGLISTETLAKKLGLVARGYKGRSGGRGGRGGSSKIAKDTSVAFSNALQSTTLKRLNSLLAGTQSGGSTSRRVATSKPVLKKITVRT